MDWISVKDRLPKRREEVLLCFDRCYARLNVGHYFITEARKVEWVVNDKIQKDVPTHWMELPALPERSATD